MRILVVSHEYPPIGGGGANACFFLSKEFAKAGNDVEIVTVAYGDDKKLEKSCGVTIHRLDSKRKNKEHCSFGEMLDYLMKALSYTKELQRQEPFDICFVFFGIPSGPIGYSLKKRFGLPYVIRFGGGDVPGFQDRFKVVYKLLGPAVRRIWDYADGLVANSQGLKRLALYFYDKNEFKVICNGIDTDFFCPGKEDRGEKNCVRILFVSRLIERKGLQYVIPMLKDIQREANKEIRLVVVGDGPYRSTLEEIAVQSNVTDLIEFAGQKDKADIVKYYQQSDIFILPSKKEGMPNVVLEAMACGLPIVMTPCQGSEELIDGNGIVSAIEDFPSNILRIINSDDMLETMGKRSIEMAENIFSWNRTANEYIKLFSLVARS